MKLCIKLQNGGYLYKTKKMFTYTQGIYIYSCVQGKYFAQILIYKMDEFHLRILTTLIIPI